MTIHRAGNIGNLFNRLALCVTLVAACAFAGKPTSAQTTTPATKPTTSPATLPAADQSTPKGALRMLFSATDAGDADLIRSIVYADTPLEQKMANTMAEMSAAMVALQNAISKNLAGDQAQAQASQRATASRVRDDLLSKLAETIDGDHAVVKLDTMGNFKPMELKNVNGKWKVLIGKSLEKADPAVVDRQLETTMIQVKVIREVASDVSAGKFKTVVEVQQSMEAKVRQALMQYVQQQSKAATQPTTAPTTQPK